MTGIGEPVWVLRVNPLPRQRLAEPQSSRILGELTEALRGALALAPAAEDALYESIRPAGGAQRRHLLALRRDVHNGRTPSVTSDLSALPAAVRDWLAAQERVAALRARLSEHHPTALRAERAVLRSLLDEPDLRQAMALLAPEVDSAARRYRAAAEPGKRERKSERGLLQYVTRALIRTSPLSRFTAVGLAVPEPGAPDPATLGFLGAHAHLALDRVMFTHIADALQVPGAPAPDSWIHQPPTAGLDTEGTRYTFLRAEEGGVRRLSAPVTGTLAVLLRLTELGPRRLSQVAAELASVLDHNVSDAVRFVVNAIGTGILCVTAVPEDGRDPQPAQLDHPELSGLAADLAELATAAPDRRPAVLASLRADTTALGKRTGRPAAVLVEEDYVMPPQRIGTETWRDQLADTAAAVEFLSMFDRLHEIRALASAAFTDLHRPGADVPLREAAGPLVAEVYRRETAFRAGEHTTTALARLRAVRRSALDAMYDLFDDGRSDDELAVHPELLRALAADLPAAQRRVPLAYGVLLQPWGRRLVFNDAYSGHGMLYGRFLGPDADMGGQAAARLAARLHAHYGRPGVELAEELGLHRLNVNARRPALDKHLTAEDWSLLRLVHDKDSDRLRIERPDGRELLPLTLGAGFPELYPAPVRLAAWLTSGGRLVTDLAGGYRAARRPQAVRLPRLSVGSLVLQRRRWYLDGQLRDTAAGHAEGPELLAALAGLRARHGLPAELLIKTDSMATRRIDFAERRRQKPQYLDLDSALLTRVLPRMLERRQPGHLEEALPRITDSPHAVEWIVEIGRLSGGPFTYLADFEGLEQPCG
ncbi:hypothetical protein ABTX60_15180 [Streptomyces sp. NPDC126510]|uniref:hypothetical protein n=1 Tax=Streptomyces sp. NPDC126510 TaxID=3155317 RepID=UPI00331DCA12